MSYRCLILWGILATFAGLVGEALTTHWSRLAGKEWWPLGRQSARIIWVVAQSVMTLWAAAVVGGEPRVFLPSCVLAWTLLSLAAVDSRSGILPNPMTAFLTISGLLTAIWFDVHFPIDNLIGAAAGLIGLAVVGEGYKAIRGREGLGFGDAKLLGGIGAWVSWPGLPTVVFFAAAMALCFVVFRAINGKKTLELDHSLPFGPFLAASGWIVWLYGPLALR